MREEMATLGPKRWTGFCQPPAGNLYDRLSAPLESHAAAVFAQRFLRRRAVMGRRRSDWLFDMLTYCAGGQPTQGGTQASDV
ncbi:hypothetical protein CHLRE_17g742132v5 [Chlamydomonas reinhardtii]|uniref:Uncharacterized protein n=1 Tax=Chlamydomonas reinhardtii TaxID=3055 RepID=A0A2K3CRU1_CHLRE|nr:uncharacterized protein CHLRE_17g742132v5 [Chlamydomonas reinhardtii]PNW70999.1 hypothetical protein CHLRE_17g742132v5 [Chlamydomonas reinhardtii]